jgi:hypothetical protein
LKGKFFVVNYLWKFPKGFLLPGTALAERYYGATAHKKGVLNTLMKMETFGHRMVMDK